MRKHFVSNATSVVPALIAAGMLCWPGFCDQPRAEKPLDVPYEPTHPAVVEAMLRAARVGAGDSVIDLGCGDGRIAIAAAEKFGARALGLDLDPQRIRESRDNASHSGINGLVEFVRKDIMEADLSGASVVTMYLLNRVNLALRPKLFRELKPGTRVVSHAFHMGDWEADRVVRHDKARGSVIYSWVMPASVGGTWRWGDDALASDCSLRLAQQFQGVGGALSCLGAPDLELSELKVDGSEISFRVFGTVVGSRSEILYRGVVGGDTIRGTQGQQVWTAKRDPVDLTGCWEVDSDSPKVKGGTLCVEWRGSDLSASFTRGGNRNGEAEPAPAFYAWGNSVRFEVADGDEPLVFSGILEDREGQGTVAREDWFVLPKWAARRLAASEIEAASSSVGSKIKEPEAGESGDEQSPADPEYTNLADGSVLTWIPGGRFWMGSERGADDERPSHEVAVSGFWLGKFEVTNSQYAQFLTAVPDTKKPMYWDDSRFNGPDQPVVGVTWQEAKAYCDWAGLRLPTEAEWEYAAAGQQLAYPTAAGEITGDAANILGVQGRDRWEFTSPAGSFSPNRFGLFDMAGNAWEWTSSAFRDYPYSASDGREAPDLHLSRVLRGGSWHSPADYCRTTARHRFASHLRYDYAGIRVALTSAGARHNRAHAALPGGASGPKH